MYPLPTLNSLCPKLKKIMKRLPMKSLTYWGISVVEAAIKNQEIVQKMAVIYKDWHKMLPLPYVGIMLQQGQPPLLPSLFNMKVVLPVQVKVTPIGVLPKSKLDRV
jgi:hypothetical protein